MPNVRTPRSCGASYLTLPRLDAPPATILAYLAERFPHIACDAWRHRMLAGAVTLADGHPVGPETSYAAGLVVQYYRAVTDEPPIPETERILFQNDHLLVADKPHFLPVVPAGPYVDECLLARLRRRTGCDAITPVHRLDRETAGLVLFALDPVTRPLYHRLFADNEISKEYVAVGERPGVEGETMNVGEERMLSHRIVPGEPWFRMRVGEGVPNAATCATMIARIGRRGLFRLSPTTGRKHQLRVQMLAIGWPIVNDRFYPDVRPHNPYDLVDPLQLVASSLAFTDPVSGERFMFESEERLEWAEAPVGSAAA